MVLLTLRMLLGVTLAAGFFFSTTNSVAEDRIQLETTTITGNTELPKILYVVPWQDVSGAEHEQQKLTLHSLFGDLFEPLSPEAPKPDTAANESR